MADLREFAFSRWLPSDARNQLIPDILDAIRGDAKREHRRAQIVFAAQGHKLPDFEERKPKPVDLALKFRSFFRTQKLRHKDG